MLAALLFAVSAQAALQGRFDASSSKDGAEASMVADGLLGTAWMEDEPGYGEGAWVELDLGRVQRIRSVSLWPGNLSEGLKSFHEYSRPRRIRLVASGAGEPVTVVTTIEDEARRVDIPLQSSARKLRIEVDQVYEGIVFADLAISEVAVNFPDPGDRLDDLLEWLDGSAARDADERHREAVRQAWARIHEAEFGDADSLAWLMDQAADGADFIRERVPKLVDVGYRAAAIRPDDDAIEALRKIRDPNAIPALEMAELRLRGRRAQDMHEIVEIFRAWQQFKGGARLNIRNWGETGWEHGAIQSFGEPIPIEIDRQGRLYLCDTGNHRVQRLTPEGGFERQWGAEPDITDHWFARGRPWYVSGARPGTDPGEFDTPLDVELIPGKEADSFAVLDALGRVQLFGPDGELQIGWKVPFESSIDPGVGGEGYLAWVRRRKLLYVVLGDEMVAYTLQGEEVQRTRLSDGTPNAVELAPGGRWLMVAAGREIVRYDLDGFRFGAILGEADLGQGFEDMDMTLDDQGRLWVVTDQGMVHEFKRARPGAELLSVRFSDISLVHPRIAAQDGIIYVVDRDHVIRLDAAQAWLDARSEREAGE